MIRLVRVVTIVAILAAGAVRSGAQPSVEAASAQAELEEAKQLNQQVKKLYEEGKYQEAFVVAKRALGISEKLLGPNHPDVARVLNDIGVLYLAQGVYAKAEQLYIRALEIRESVLGPSHPDVAETLSNLAMLYQVQGSYAKAEPLYLRGLQIREAVLGPNHPDVSRVLNNLAGFYQAQGVYDKAEALFVRALDIREKALGPNHPDVARVLNNLASLYQTQGAYDKSERPCVRALEIREKAFGPEHPEVARALINLAMLYQAQGAYNKAHPLHIRAQAIYEKVLGPNHPDVAISLNNLGGLYYDQGLHSKAEPLFVHALKIREKALGPNHPDVADSLSNLALLYVAQDAYAQAKLFLARAADIREQQLRIDLVRLPELRKRALMLHFQRDTDRVISFHADAMSDNTAARDVAFTTILRRKGRILDSLLDSESRIRRNLTARLREMLEQLSRARSDLAAHLYARGGRNLVDRAAADVARARIDELEAKLSAASAEFRTEVESVTIAKVRAQIPNGAALVEFSRYRRLDPKKPRRSQLQEERYVAYLLTSRGEPTWVALGEAAPIDAQVDAVLATIRDNAPMETTRAALQRLDALVLAPVRAKLPRISHLIFAPDGKLNLVPFEALVNPQGHYALENYLISYVTTGRDLLRIAATRAPKSPAVIVADPDYGPLPALGPGTFSLTPLPDAKAEAADLQLYFSAAPLTGANATKAALASLTAPAIIHIATHGFYARDVPSGRPAPGVLRDMARGFDVEETAASQGASSRSDDMADGLDRAGLALAGANQGADGIVTAREIGGLDWWGTQLVVLSACETGVGAASSGDGVYGLRRALVLAGAASQVVSLWNVEDASTRQLMSEFYSNLARGVGRAEALRQAKLSLLHQQKYEHPFYWAPFIAAGDWRPLPEGILAPRKAAP